MVSLLLLGAKLALFSQGSWSFFLDVLEVEKQAKEDGQVSQVQNGAAPDGRRVGVPSQLHQSPQE